jgi:hypothetical protein
MVIEPARISIDPALPSVSEIAITCAPSSNELVHIDLDRSGISRSDLSIAEYSRGSGVAVGIEEDRVRSNIHSPCCARRSGIGGNPPQIEDVKLVCHVYRNIAGVPRRAFNSFTEYSAKQPGQLLTVDLDGIRRDIDRPCIACSLGAGVDLSVRDHG